VYREGGADPLRLPPPPQVVKRPSLLLPCTCCRKELVRLPGGLIARQQQSSGLQSLIRCLADRSEGARPVRVLDLNTPGRPLSLDRDPPRLTGFAVVVPADTAVLDQGHQVREPHRLDRGKVTTITSCPATDHTPLHAWHLPLHATRIGQAGHRPTPPGDDTDATAVCGCQAEHVPPETDIELRLALREPPTGLHRMKPETTVSFNMPPLHGRIPRHRSVTTLSLTPSEGTVL